MVLLLFYITIWNRTCVHVKSEKSIVFLGGGGGEFNKLSSPDVTTICKKRKPTLTNHWNLRGKKSYLQRNSCEFILKEWILGLSTFIQLNATVRKLYYLFIESSINEIAGDIFFFFCISTLCWNTASFYGEILSRLSRKAVCPKHVSYAI